MTAAANPSSPQAREMADESMVRTLAAQANAIWPQEEPIFARHPPARGSAGARRGLRHRRDRRALCERFAGASFLGVDGRIWRAPASAACGSAFSFGDHHGPAAMGFRSLRPGGIPWAAAVMDLPLERPRTLRCPRG